ncbi:NACHT domain-containing protein [Emticicia sediminis]
MKKDTLYKLNNREAEIIKNRYFEIPKIGKSINALRLDKIVTLLNEQGEANLQEVLEEAFDDSKDALNALATAAKDIEEKAKANGFNLILKRDNNKKLAPQYRILWIEGDNIKKEKVLNEAFDSITQPLSYIENRAKMLNQITIEVCFADKERGVAYELIDKLQDRLSLLRDIKFELKKYSEVFTGDNREERIREKLISADLLLLLESPAFYNDAEIQKYQSFFVKDKICCLGFVSLGNDPDRRFCNGLEIFTLDKKYYIDFSLKNQSDFLQKFAEEIKNKVRLIEVKRLETHRNRIERLDEDIPLDSKTFIDTKVKRESLLRLTNKSVWQENKGENALELLNEWVMNKESPQLFALLGQYGMGKTFTSKVFAKQQIEKYQKGQVKFIPLYFDLRDFDHRILDRDDFDIWKIIEAILHKRKAASDMTPLKASDIREIWNNYDTLIIFDGLDEVTAHLGDKKVESFFLNEIFKLVPNYRSKVSVKKDELVRKMLFTCRTDYFKSITEQSSFFQAGNRQFIDAKEDYLSAVLLPFDEGQIKEYLKQVFTDKDPDKIYATLSEIHNLAELSQRPVLLNFLGEIIEDIEAIALENTNITTANIYDRVVHKSFDRDSAKHEIPVSIKIKVLEEIAAFLWKRTNRTIEFDKLEEFLSEYLANGSAAMKKLYSNKAEEALYKDLRNATLLVRSDEKNFGFSHTSVQEYFLAKYILDKLNKAEYTFLKLQNISPETIDFVLDMLPNDIEDITLINDNFTKGFEQEDVLCRNLLFQIYISDQKRSSQIEKPKFFNLERLKIESIHLEGTTQQLIDFSGIILKNTLLDNCRWVNVNLKGADFTEANLYRSHFENIDLAGANFTASKLRGKWRNVNLEGVTTNAETNLQYLEISKTKPVVPFKVINSNLAVDRKISGNLLGSHSNNIRYCSVIDSERAISCTYDNSLIVWNLLNGKMLHHLQGHSDSVRHCSYIDSSRAISCSEDNSLIVWDLLVGKIQHHLKGHSNSVNYCSIIDSKRAISCSDDYSLIVWDLVDGKMLFHLKGHKDWVRHCSVIDSERAISCSDDNSLIVWDLLKGTILHRLHGHTSRVRFCDVIDSKRAISCSDDNNLIVWDLVDGKMLFHLKGHKDWIRHCSVIDSERAISCSDDNSLIVWDLLNGTILHQLQGHNSIVRHCSVIDSKRVISCSDDNSLIVWDLLSGKILHRLPYHSRKVRHCSVIDVERAISCSWDNSLIIWNLLDGKIIHKLQGHSLNGELCSVIDNERAISCAWDKSLIVWDSLNGKMLHHLQGHSSYVTHCRVIDSERAISCSWDNSLIVWDLLDGKILHHLNGHSDWVNYCSVIDSERVLSCSDDDSLIVWDLLSGKMLHHLKGHSNYVTHCSVIDGERAISCSDDKSLIVWDLLGGKILCHLKGHSSSVRHCSVIDSERAISCSDDKSLIVWDLLGGKILHRLQFHSGSVTHCRVIDSERAISCSNDSLIVWDLVNGKVLHHLQGHINSVTYCNIIDSERAISCSEDKSLIVWDLLSGKILYHLKGHSESVNHCSVIDRVRVISAGDDCMIEWNIDTGEMVKKYYHLVEGGYACISASGELLDYSTNAWEHLCWETEDAQGVTKYLHFDEVIL